MPKAIPENELRAMSHEGLVGLLIHTAMVQTVRSLGRAGDDTQAKLEALKADFAPAEGRIGFISRGPNRSRLVIESKESAAFELGKAAQKSGPCHPALDPKLEALIRAWPGEPGYHDSTIAAWKKGYGAN